MGLINREIIALGQCWRGLGQGQVISSISSLSIFCLKICVIVDIILIQKNQNLVFGQAFISYFKCHILLAT